MILTPFGWERVSMIADAIVPNQEALKLTIPHISYSSPQTGAITSWPS